MSWTLGLAFCFGPVQGAGARHHNPEAEVRLMEGVQRRGGWLGVKWDVSLGRARGACACPKLEAGFGGTGLTRRERTKSTAASAAT